MAELADAYGSGPYGGNFMQVQVLFPAPWRVFLQHLKSCEDTCFLFITFFICSKVGKYAVLNAPYSCIYLSRSLLLYLLALNLHDHERKLCFCSKANRIVVMLIFAIMHLHISENTVSKHTIRSNNILHKLAFKST